MGHKSSIKALNALAKVRVTMFDTDDVINHLNQESDRAVIILLGSLLDDLLKEALATRFGKNLDSDTLERLFDASGALGTFSSRIHVGGGDGVYPAWMHSKLNLIRAMRNAAAHAHSPINFGVRELREAVAALHSEAAQKTMVEWDDLAFRRLFISTSAYFAAVIDGSHGVTDALYEPLSLIALVDWQKRHEKRLAG